VVGGRILRVPAIQSPNFSAGAAGWQINQNGTAQFNELTLVIQGTGTAALLIYQGAPAAGNLIGSWASAPGTDPYGNSYGAGLVVGVDGPQVSVMTPPAGAVLAFPTGEADETATGQLAASVINAGAANQYLQLLLTGPAGTGNNGNNFTISLNSDTDDGTGEAELCIYDLAGVTYLALANTGGDPQMFLGCAPGVSGFLPVTVQGALLSYADEGQQVSYTYSSPVGEAFNIPVPAGVTTAKVECLGGGAGGQGVSGPGGGSAEYAAEPALAVTTAAGISAFIGAGGTRGSSASPAGGAGGTTTAAGTSVTVTAHGAPANNNTAGGLQSSAGGSGSTNTTHRNGSGASSYDGSTNGGGGGAGAPSAGAAGGTGGENYQTQPGSGGAPGAGGFGGHGGGGGWGSATSEENITGGADGYGGGGSGGGSGGAYGVTTGATGGYGEPGAIRVTYTLPGTPAIASSLASTAYTDPAGNKAPAGFQGQITAVQPGSSPSTPESWHSFSLPSGFTGTLRYKLTPLNAVLIDCDITGSQTGTTVAIGTLPAGYVPANECRFAVGNNIPGSWTQSLGIASTSGAVTVPGLPASTATRVCFTALIPLD
jgi:hypothetical protein